MVEALFATDSPVPKEKPRSHIMRPGLIHFVRTENESTHWSWARSLSWNWSASVESAIAVVEDLPPETACATASK